MSARRKFLFDNDFGAPKAKTAAVPDEPVIALAAHQAELAKRVAEAQLRGRAEAEAGVNARIAETLARLSHAFSASSASLGEALESVERDAAALAIAVARRIAGQSMAQETLGELEALVRRAFAELGQAPHVAVRVADCDLNGATPRLETIARETGFAGRLVLLADPDLLPGDVRVEWTGGGLARDRASIERAVDALFETHLAPESPAEEVLS